MSFPTPAWTTITAAILACASASAGEKSSKPIDFNREIRPILSNACFTCHGPDANKRKGVNKPLRLDTEEGAFADLGGYAAFVRGKPEESEVITRIKSVDTNEVMPPPSHAHQLTPREIEVIATWVAQGAPFAKHWSYVKPTSPAPPEVRDKAWPRNAIDRFLLAKLESEGLKSSPEADPKALIRRVSLDLTGLPPTPQEVKTFLDDKAPGAYERLVDRLLAKPAYGEHWGRLWLDLARYADSAGYADDPARTIWAYRDYVIRSFNANKPFDQFTIEQVAGDLLPNPTEDQLIATAFHRNTLTNNEGGTNDEEFRNVAVIDRVNTTMAVWMGTTIACAQCHDHKYDPLSQKDYFRFFAFLNNSEDADRTDESPLYQIYSDAQKRQKADWQTEIARLETKLKTPSPDILAGQKRWESAYATGPAWTPTAPATASSKSGIALAILDDRSILGASKAKTDVYTVTIPLDKTRFSALRLETLPDDARPGKAATRTFGNFVVSRVTATINPPKGKSTAARYVRVELPGKAKMLSLAEVQVFSGAENVAPKGEAKQSSVDFDGPAKLAIDGKTDGRFAEAKSTTHTAISDDPWWEVDLKSSRPIDRIAVWNRTDNGVESRLSDFRVILLDEKHQPVWTQSVTKPPLPSTELAVSGVRPVAFASALADFAQTDFAAASILDNTKPADKGWAVAPQIDRPHTLTLVPKAPVEVEPGSTLTVAIEQSYKEANHTIGRFRLATTDDPKAVEFAGTPDAIAAILKTPADRRTDAQRVALTTHYLANVAPELKATRDQVASLKSQLAAMKPETTVPILREMGQGARRKTNLQRRGNYQDLGDELSEGVPAVFPPLPADAPKNRLALARWLISPDNPMTARVIANRYWEQIFGTGIVATSEDFGAQGDLPSHPELLDWLASDLMKNRWDLKHFLRLLVTSAAYRQSSKVTPESISRDPDNRLLARGPRVRLSAEMIRDQALAVSGLLSPKMFGPPVKPPQPSAGLSAAFGGSVDWETSKGEDRFRRGIYTTWRRSSPYPSMATFDAPNREVCTLRRTRTNTPLQALVTLNDPVYVEAAQALGRRMDAGGKTPLDKVRAGVRLSLVRDPSDEEAARLVRLYESTRATFAKDAARAKQLATEPIGPAPKDANLADLAAWTVVGNVLLNLDEMLMKR
jgi:hypothetical protein